MKNSLTFLAVFVAGTLPLLGALPGGAVAVADPLEGTLSSGDFTVRNIQLAKDFKLELIHVVPTDQVAGGWVGIAIDPKGRVYAASRQGRIYRLTVPAPGAPGETVSELVDVPVGGSDGMLWAFDSLYVMSEGRGLFRVTDSDGDDKLDKVVAIRSMPFGGDHGIHTVEPGPDGNSLYINNGNSTRLTDIDSSLVWTNWGEDVLLPRIPTGFMDSSYAPQGWIARTDKDGKKWELFASGLRNQYDIKFNNVGELFVWDADMEWDMGEPWYRPTGVSHVISGAEFGFRNGSGKWPLHYLDSWGRLINIGRGSPTGDSFGYGAKFPKKYQDAFFIGDNSYGRIWAIHMTPAGSTYTAEAELFLSAQPYASSDMAVNPVHGALYTLTGGRGQSGVYRITYIGNESTAPTTPDLRFQAQRDQRHNLEKFHGHRDPAAVSAVWPFLNNADRAIRFAARTALEWQDPATWRERALTDPDMRTTIAAIVALARVSGKDDIFRQPNDPASDTSLRARMLTALDRFNYRMISYEDRLDLLRAYALVFIRMQRPDDATIQRYIAKFDPLFPAESREENSELADMLVYLQAPSAATKIMRLLREAPSKPHTPDALWIHPETQGTPVETLVKQKEQIQYALALRLLKTGWTQPLREEYFKWFVSAYENYRGGNTWQSSQNRIRQDAIDNLTEAERTALEPILALRPAPRAGGGAGAAGPGTGARAGGAPPAGQ